MLAAECDLEAIQAQGSGVVAEAQGRVLVVAGSDSGGGAGVQADIKAVTAMGGYAATAITAITVQNTLGVDATHPIPPDVVADQMRAVLTDIGADAVKTGMLADTAMVEAVAAAYDAHAGGAILVADPVMMAKGGARLLAEEAVEAVCAEIVPRAHVLTPNAPEAAALTGLEVESLDGQHRAGDALLQMGAKAVLIKGGHVPGPIVTDLLLTADQNLVFEDHRIESRHTHGTGCTLASAIAAGLALGLGLTTAVEVARTYVREAIRRAPGFGAGCGPMDHAWPLRAGIAAGVVGGPAAQPARRRA